MTDTSHEPDRNAAPWWLFTPLFWVVAGAAIGRLIDVGARLLR